MKVNEVWAKAIIAQALAEIKTPQDAPRVIAKVECTPLGVRADLMRVFREFAAKRVKILEGQTALKPRPQEASELTKSLFEEAVTQHECRKRKAKKEAETEENEIEESKLKSFTVSYSGSITVEAEDDADATGQVYDLLQEACAGEFSIDGSTED